MTPQIKLDKVLTYLDNDITHRETFSEIMDNLDFEISDKDLELVLEKLCIDGYVIKLPSIRPDGSPDPNPIMIYNISFEGKYFKSIGGYVQQQKDKSNDRKRIERNDLMLANGTVALAIGTFGLLFWEILIHWNEFVKLFCHC